MDFALNYRRSAVPFTKPIVSSVLQEFQSFYKWNNTIDDEERKALDIGCGEATVTVEVLKPFLPGSTRLDGADKSNDMMRLAKHSYKEQVSKFFWLDVEAEKLDESILKSYNHVFSFFCFHYVGNLKQALQNIYDMLKPNGNFIFVFMPNLPFYKALKDVSLNPKWSSYMQDFDAMCPRPVAEEKYPHKVFAELMSACGFRNIVTKVDVRRWLFDSMEKIEGQARYVDQFHKRMPIELHEEYFATYFQALKKIQGFSTEKFKDNGELVGVVETLEVMIGYGEKGAQ